MFCLGAITILIFLVRFALFNFQESPKFLLSRGKDNQAVKVLAYIASINKVPCNITLESFNSLVRESEMNSNEEVSDGQVTEVGDNSRPSSLSLSDKLKLELTRLEVLFGTPSMAWLTIAIWIVYMFDYWGFTISGAYLPIILQDKGTEIGVSREATYRSYIYIYLFGFPGVLLGTTIYKWRQPSMIISSALFCAMLFTFTTVSSEASYIGISGLVYFFQSMFNAILYGSTPECFPAPVRGTACGIASFWGRLFSIIAPIAAGHVYTTGANSVLYLAGGGALVSTVFLCLLPRKHIGGQSYLP